MDSKGTASFQAVDIYDTSDDGEVYLSRDQLKSGTVIVKPDSSDSYTIDTQKPLKESTISIKDTLFSKKVSILCESDEYYIVQEGDSYGLFKLRSYRTKTEPVFPLMMLYFSNLVFVAL